MTIISAEIYQTPPDHNCSVACAICGGDREIIEGLTDQIDGLLRWVIEGIGYPYNQWTDPPIPVGVRQRLAELWAEHEGGDFPGGRLEDYSETMAIEGHW